ncbi:MAG: coniferyl aldehyde dehydrogenase [Polyangiaceae bacterium]
MSLAQEAQSDSGTQKIAARDGAPESGDATKKEAASPKGLDATLATLKAACRKHGSPSYDKRIEHLEALKRVLLTNKEEIARAISADFGSRSRTESLVAEVFVTIAGIDYAKERLHEWMDVEPREVAWTFLPGRAEVHNQPLGVVGIIAPWNYPVQLVFAPLVAALAAGNRAMVKPSELVPETSALIAKMIASAFAPDHVTCHEGGVEVSEAFSRLAFDHLIFTGSTRVGKAVMKAAAENLVPVTLELGGKSPAIVGRDFSIATAAYRIMSGKLFNAGQTCIAPDYALVPRKEVDAFVAECKAIVARMYPTLIGNADYTAVVNARQKARLEGYLSEAAEKGAKVVRLNPANESFEGSKKLEPTLVLGGTDEMAVLSEEIFGPILPILPYDTLDDAIAYVNDRPRPLALYVFDHDEEAVEKVLSETTSGGVTVNDTMLHIAQDDMPFGGVGPSGMGHYHGKEGFDALTKKKPVFYQARLNASDLMRPPFGKAIDYFLKFVLGK